VSGRYNLVSVYQAGMTQDSGVKRSRIGAGWFVTPLQLTKVEHVHQRHLDFPTRDIRDGGRSKGGFLLGGVIAFPRCHW
jgi:hypothetical protein